METFGQRLKRLREAAGITRLQLAEAIGITRSSVALVENGQSQSMKGRNLLKAAEVIGVPPEVLEFGDEGAARMVAEAQRTGYTPKRAAARAMRMPAQVRPVPVVGFVVANPTEDGYFDDAGFPPGAGDGFVSWPTRDPNAYALRVRGDSMQPRIRPDEVIVVEPNSNITPGSDVVVRCKDGRKMVKQLLFQRGENVTLGSINIAHRQVTLAVADIESMHYVGAVVPSAAVTDAIAPPPDLDE